MKVIHLNTYDGNGGAGRACLRLNKALLQQDVNSEVWANYKFGNSTHINSFSKQPLNKALTAFGILLERFGSSAFAKKLKIPFSVPIWGRDISEHPALKEADIIHLHWVNHGFLRPKDLAKLKKLNKPIVWTFHDSNAFTGGCHVRYGCDHFEHECGNCPLLKKAHANDLSHRIWEAKSKVYKQINPVIVAPSKWMAASVKRSKLFSNADITIIPNTLETTIFKPYSKSSSKKHLDLNPEKFIMLSGFMPSRKDLHKGTPYLIEALQILISQKLVDPENMELIVFGNRDEKNVPDFPVKTTFLGTISNDEKLAICYSAADVFLTPSLEDNLPNTVMESLSCGTPVIAFTTGGIPDMVTHLENGYLAEYRSAEDFAKGIAWAYHYEKRESLNAQARRGVEEQFSEITIADKHITLYNRLLNKSGIKTPTLSVITVVYNNVKDIERTMLSVFNQSYPHIEYVVIDGGSTDGTLEIIHKYQERISLILSEPDNGIYDAMNKGLQLATGDYVLFMNSGDEIHAHDTVETVFASADDADIYYGETEMFDKNWQSLGCRRHQSPLQLNSESFKYGMSVSHQAIYVRRSLVTPFNTDFKLSADIDWVLAAINRAKKIVNTKKYVAKYLAGGLSKKRHKESLIERFKIFSKHYGLIPNIFNHLVIAFNLGFYFLKNRKTND